MARVPGLSSPSLSPFGSSGAGFGAFNVGDSVTQTAYLTFLKVENAWQNGTVDDPTYLAALKKYAAALPAGSSSQLNAEQQFQETTYRVHRNLLVDQIGQGTKTFGDLLSFDKKALTGLNTSSQTYRDRLDLYQQTQGQVFSEAEAKISTQYQNGSITTAQLQAWYRGEQAKYADNHQLADSIGKKVTSLDSRILDERDSQTIQDYNAGKLTDDQFLVYAQAARARYATGTSQASDWDQRIQTAQSAKQENGLLYRYGLSQQYAQLEQFVASSSGRSLGGTSTSTSKRVVLGADGNWHTITTTTSRPVAPSASEQAAYKKLQIEVTDAKRQMSEIVKELGVSPDHGAWVTTDAMIAYYTGRQQTLAKGSADWYAMQQKIDSLNETKHKETVLGSEGIKITYPGVKTSSGTPASQPRAASGSGVTLDSFMRSLARVESSGNYTARNKTSGAYGKYQIMPANWPAWAKTYLGNANAPQTPENQEKVVRGKLTDLYKYLGSWQAVAYWWNNGGTKEVATNPANWTAGGRRYVGNVMGGLGVSLPPAPTGANTGGGSAAAPAGSPSTTPSTAQQRPTNQGGVGGLTQLVSVDRPAVRSGSQQISTAAAGFPVNFDGSAFTKFYSAYVDAFTSGAESFTDNSTGKTITYFIGSNADDRIARMRQLDELRLGYYEERMKAYQGTPSEITAAADYQRAVKDYATHEYQILDVVATSKGGELDRASINPIGGGVTLLQKTEAAIKSELQMAQDAYDRGDVQAAYSHLQLAKNLQVENSGLLDRYNAAAQALVAKIGQSTGISVSQSGAGETLSKDMADLANWGPALEQALSDGDQLLSSIRTETKPDPANPGQVTLADGYARFIDQSGNVKIAPLSPGINPASGKADQAPQGQQQVLVRIGNTVETAYAAYHVDNVGYFATPDGNHYAIQGKVITVKVNGQVQTLYENPLNPGHWSSSAVTYSAPAGFKASGVGANTVYSFTSPTDSTMTYTFSLDPSSGTYLLVGNRPAGLFNQPVDNQVVGGAGDANVLALLGSAGFQRTSIGGGLYTDSDIAAFGMTPDELSTYRYGPKMSPAALLNAVPKMRPTPISGALAKDYSPEEQALLQHVAPPAATMPAGKQADDTYVPSSPAPLPGITPIPAGKQADDTWYSTQKQTQATLPPVTVKPTPISASLAKDYSSAEQQVIKRAPAPAPKPAPLPPPKPLPVVKPINTTTRTAF